MWRVLKSRKTRIALACSPFALGALVAAAFPVTNWLGRRAVERHVARLEAEGHAVDPERYWSAVRPEDDVFQHPVMVQELEQKKVVSISDREPAIPGLASRPVSRSVRPPKRELEFAKGLDVRLWFAPPETDERIAAERLLKEMADTVQRLDDLQPALDRPVAAWPVERTKNELTQGIEVPQIATSVLGFRRIVGAYGEVAMLKLATGDALAASKDAGAVLRIAALNLEHKPSILSLLVADATLQVAHGIIWEGVLRERWTEPVLLEFERKLATLRPQQAASQCYLGEIAFARSKAELLLALSEKPRPRSSFPLTQDWKWERERILGRIRGIWRDLRPRGVELMKWVESDRVFIDNARQTSGGARTRFSSADLKFFRDRYQSCPEAWLINPGWLSDRRDVDADGWSQLVILAQNALVLEAKVDLLRTGIALERHRLAEGRLPGDLKELVPAYLAELPLDPYDGKPLRYRIQPDGSPLLWSIGSDLVDEGGLPHLDRNTKGDLVWITQPIPGFTKKQLRR
jgi:hypothetical protein